MFRTVQWTSGTRLSCVGCAPAKVILCIDPDLLAERTCPTSDVLSADTPEGIYSWNTIEAELVDSVQVKNNCGGAYFYRYTFNYDDAFIITGGNLSSSDIIGAVCKGCLTQYAEDLAGNEIVLERIPADGDVPAHMALTTQHGCVYEFYEGTAAAAGEVVSDTLDDGDVVNVDLAAIGDYTIAPPSSSMILTNPSDVYAMTVHVTFTGNVYLQADSGWQGLFNLEVAVDGAAAASVAGQQFNNTGTDGTNGNAFINLSFTEIYEVVAGGTLDLSIGITETTQSGLSQAGLAVSFTQRIVALGITHSN